MLGQATPLIAEDCLDPGIGRSYLLQGQLLVTKSFVAEPVGLGTWLASHL